MKGSIAAGHPLTAGAGAAILEKGGNAFDAVIAAGLVSIVAEPALTSFGGGGFLLAHISDGNEDILFDFFVNTPGIEYEGDSPPSMTPVEIKFPGCTQVFHTGYASAAVPGTLKGFLHIFERLCTMPLEVLAAPAVEILRKGVVVNERQSVFLGLLEPIMTSSEYGKKIFAPHGRYASEGDRIFNPELLEFFEELLNGGADIYSGRHADALIDSAQKEGGLITMSDLAGYRVVEREPLRIVYGDREILTNPPPSLGGAKLKLSLEILKRLGPLLPGSDRIKYGLTLAEVMKKVYMSRPEDLDAGDAAAAIQDETSRRLTISSRGTTHISVMDELGNAASMTTSNGSGSGCYIPGTGIMLNNMMGEDDLHPDGFFSSPPGSRVSSMMLPTLVTREGEVEYVMGSGGSKRIRSAVLQVILNLIEAEMAIRDAVEAPRMHYEDGMLHLEPGMREDVVRELRKFYELKRWEVKDMYFGGVHCVGRGMDGWGDSRRGGCFITAPG